MQTPSQHRHMHPSIDRGTETASDSQAAKQTPQRTTPPTTVPRGKRPAQQTEACNRKATAHTTKRLYPPRRRTTNIQASQSQRHSHSNGDTTHPSIRLWGHSENHQPQAHTTHQEPPSRQTNLTPVQGQEARCSRTQKTKDNISLLKHLTQPLSPSGPSVSPIAIFDYALILV
ncbi:hypothetical protein CRENBAI_015648 [Crenichthys baileyi]|uniref:Uncharacterized protein n=1 Tax=Crenichthys baileyi TaxID=28760 RepID=A0AAV9SIS0_9TELE